MQEKIVAVLNEMSEYLSIAQMKKLQEVIIKTFAENEAVKTNISNKDFLEMFLAAKRVEGCSDRTLQYYRVTVAHMFTQIDTEVRKITMEEIRSYLANYQKRNDCSNVTIDNVRRNISSFFSYCGVRLVHSKTMKRNTEISPLVSLFGKSSVLTWLQLRQLLQTIWMKPIWTADRYILSIRL